MDMEDISIKLKAENSSGEQELYLTKQTLDDGGEEFFFTLCGEYNGEKIQIGFDELTREDLEEMREQINLILELIS